MTVLSWKHHTLIQSLLSRGPLKEHEFHSIFSHITGKDPGVHQNIFNDYLRKINMELSYVQFELRACRNQYDGNVYYGVVNNVADEQSKLGTKYTVPQIAFYKSIIEAIVQNATAQGSISNMDALNLRLENQVSTGTGSQSQASSSHVPPAFKNFSMSQKEKTLEQLIEDKWLFSNPDGEIGLGVRSFLDLRSWFHNNDVPTCNVCNEAGLKAELCPNESCAVRIHQYCLERKFAQRGVERVCPGCGRQWQYKMPKAEAVEVNDDDPIGPSQNQPTHEPIMRKRARSSRTVDVGTSRSGWTEDTVPVSNLKKTARTSSRLRSDS